MSGKQIAVTAVVALVVAVAYDRYKSGAPAARGRMRVAS